MSQIRLYFEGNRGLVRPFQLFFERADPNLKRKIKFFPGRGRDDTIYDFLLGASQHPTLTHLLLVDSEGPDDGQLFQKLTQEGSWRPRGEIPGEGQIGWMVQVMEAWFLADRTALHAYYGSGFQVSALPANPRVEAVSKSDVLNGLKAATRQSAKGSYHKGSHAPRILEKLDPNQVRHAARNCDRLLNILTEVVST